MSSTEAKKLAKQFIDDQKRILEEHGDGVVRSKYRDAVAGAQKTFEIISSSSKKLASTHSSSR